MSTSFVERMTDAAVAERSELVEVAADLARRHLAPVALALDDGDPAAFGACWARVRELGLDRALLPDRFGGPGLEVGDLLALVEELAVGDGGVALCVLLSNAAVASLPRERAAAIPEGERWAAVPVPLPPAAGSRAMHVERQDGEARLDGSVLSALGAHGAEGIIVLAGDEAVAVSAAVAGLSTERTDGQMGLGSAAAADLRFAAVRPTGGEPGPAAERPDAARALILAGVAALARGISRRAYELALSYAESRHQGGAAIVEHGAVRSLLAEMAARLRGGSAPASGAGSNDGTGRPPLDRAAALAAKVRATDDALATAADAVQVLGGVGYMREAGAEKLMRDAKYCQLYPEPNWVARDRLLDLERQRRRRTPGRAPAATLG